MRQILDQEHPEAAVSLSSDVLREYREYERAMTTLVDAAVKPRVARYVATIAGRLAAMAPGHTVPFYVMKSNGGVLSAAEVVHQPITTVLSGPAAGALGAAMVTTAAGFGRVLTLDGGGTSTDVSVVLDGEPTLTTEGSVGGYPSKVPMIDVVTVGAGGGSVAWLSREGGLKVGPRSAGADPGPLCYGRGGTEPTVTDANLVLGRIPPHLLGGEVPLDPAAAAAGLEALGSKLGMGLAPVAAGVLEIAAWNQANALRQVTVRAAWTCATSSWPPSAGRGRWPSAGCWSCSTCPRPSSPATPATCPPSACSPSTSRTTRSRPRSPATPSSTRAPSPPPWPPSRSGPPAPWTPRASPAPPTATSARPTSATTARPSRSASRSPTARSTPPPPRPPWPPSTTPTTTLYGYSFRDDPAQQVEWVNLRVTGIGPIRRPTLRPAPSRAATAQGVPHPRPRGPGAPEREGSPGPERVLGAVHRPACFDPASGFVDTAIYRRDDLGPGDLVEGPAVVEEYGATVPLHPGFRAEVDRFGNLVVTRGAS